MWDLVAVKFQVKVWVLMLCSDVGYAASIFTLEMHISIWLHSSEDLNLRHTSVGLWSTG